MPSPEVEAEIKALEILYHHYEKLLDQSISNNDILDKTKIIYHDLKEVSDKLQKLKASN